MNSRLERVAIVILLLFAAALDTVGIQFYLPRHYDPSPDSIHPAISLDAFDSLFAERHTSGIKYPRLHLVVTGAAQRAWLGCRHGGDGGRIASEIVARLRNPDLSGGMLGFRDQFRPWRDDLSELILIGRAISALCGVLLVYGMLRLGRWILTPLEGFIAAFATAVCYPVVYYAHTLNVDATYLCLGVFALGSAIHAVKRRCGRALCAAAVLAALAMAVKDQAYGWFVLTIPFVLWRWVRGSGETDRRPFPVKAALVAFGVSALVYAVALGLPFDIAGVKAHFAHVTGSGSEAYQLYEASFAGQMRLLHEVGLHVLDAMGWPLLIAALLGLARLAYGNRLALAAILVPAVSYHLTFLAPIRYCYQRFTLPITLLLFVAAAAGFGVLLRRRHLKFVGMLLLFVFFGERVQRAIEVDAMLAEDPQGRAAAWLDREIPAGAVVAAALELPLSNVEIPERARVELIPPGQMPRRADGEPPPPYIVFALYDPMRTSFAPSPPLAAVPESAKVLGRDYDRVAEFAPLYDHPLRHGAAFLPTIGVYRLRE